MQSINKYYNFLSRVSLFDGIDDKDLEQLFEDMHIKQYHRGEMVTFDTEEHAKCYITYEGLFKLTRVDEKGEEIVISIVDKADAISPMYFSEHYDVCAEFVKNTTLLSFNKDVIDAFASKNHQFALNIINFLAGNVQKLMLSKEVLQLKTTKEKVGWYLVHAKIDNSFTLPYSKHLIASYLGMKPESFSRALLNLKKEGISLEGKSIVLDTGDELCKYCDRVTGSNCQEFLSDRCMH